jgi:hypothetical protein
LHESLLHLDLSGNSRISDNALSKCVNLTHLNLNYNRNITSRGVCVCVCVCVRKTSHNYSMSFE